MSGLISKEALIKELNELRRYVPVPSYKDVFDILMKSKAIEQGEAVDALEELERALCLIGVVGNVDGHDVIRRDSVINVARQRIKAQK